MTTPLKKIVIVGGGAGGLEMATQLGHKLGRKKKAKITLVDRNHSHLWKPLLHEVATGSLDEGVDALSYLAHARNHGFQFQLGSVIDIDREAKTITIAELRDEKGELLVPERKIAYDTLVMALGSTSNDFNTPGVKENCIFLDNPHQARRFHQEMLNLFLKYSANLGANGKVNIAIVGGGATGVELSAELHNAVKQLHSYGYKGLTNEALNVTLVEAGERILPALPPRISAAAHNELTKLGVRVLTQTMVTSADEGGLHTKDGEYIEADLMVWAAGIKVPDFLKYIGGLETNRINQTTTIIEKTKGLDEPMILTGDFNALADSGPMKILYERFEIGCLNGNYGLTTGTPVPVKAIDFVLYTPDEGMSPKAYDVYYDAYVESDHFPVVATFSIND